MTTRVKKLRLAKKFASGKKTEFARQMQLVEQALETQGLTHKQTPRAATLL